MIVMVSHLSAFWHMAIMATNDSGSIASPRGLPPGGLGAAPVFLVLAIAQVVRSLLWFRVR